MIGECALCENRFIEKKEIPCIYCIWNKERDKSKPGSDLWSEPISGYEYEEDNIYWDDETETYLLLSNEKT